MCGKPADVFAREFLLRGPLWSYGRLDVAQTQDIARLLFGIRGLCDVLGLIFHSPCEHRPPIRQGSFTPRLYLAEGEPGCEGEVTREVSGRPSGTSCGIGRRHIFMRCAHRQMTRQSAVRITRKTCQRDPKWIEA